MASEPRASATVVLFRPAGASTPGVEVLLLRRPSAHDFGNAFVFPGGCVEDQDSELAQLCTGLDDTAASRMLGVSQGGLSYWAAAIRECFEESGVLLACDAQGRMFRPGSALEASRLADYRQLLLAGTMSLLELCRAERLRLAADALQYFAYWVTPAHVPRRYATRFFAAAAPAMQVARHDGMETLETRWISPPAALAQAGGSFELRPPTQRTLAQFTEASSVDEAMAAARARAQSGIRPVMPVLRTIDGREQFLLPGDPAYPASPEGLPHG
ncbi:MAG: NUDIX hydrolase [Gammaproteobacteria bacterium]|nr:NUDIX hydrolase [Gammaproteobacteria bacterium]